MWRIVLSYADAFYPHIAFFDVQFVLCMARMIASAPTASITFLSHLVELWPVVLDMALCMAYWLRNVLAGRPLTREAAGAHGGKRSWSASDDKDAAGDEPPRQRHAGVGADGAPADTPAAASGARPPTTRRRPRCARARAKQTRGVVQARRWRTRQRARTRGGRRSSRTTLPRSRGWQR